MSDVTKWVEKALEAAKGRLDVIELPSADAADAVRCAMATFVDGSARFWWWEQFKFPAARFEVPDGADFSYLRTAWPSGDPRALFIPEDGTGRHRVFDASLDGVVGVLSDCPFFEYYVVAKDFRWLLAENHHNSLLVCRA